MDVPAAELAAEVAYQIGALEVFARAAGSRVAYVKPHGALYNRVVRDAEQAAAVVEGVLLADRTLPVLGLPGSRLHEAAAEAGLPAVPEAFGDRAYLADGSLLPRGQEGAVVSDPAEVVERSVSMARSGVVTAHCGSSVTVRARSLCLHGDTPGAAGLARRVREGLEASGIRVEAFA